MKKLVFGLLAGGFVAVLFLTGGCKLDTTAPSFTEFGIQVDSIQYPDTIPFGKTLNIKFYGTIGPSTCYSLSRFTGGISGQQINIAVLGKFANNESTCASAVQYMNGDSLGVNLTASGKYIIHVMQPTPPDIYDTVVVRKAVTPMQ